MSITETGCLRLKWLESINADAVELIKMLTGSIKTVKQSLTTNR